MSEICEKTELVEKSRHMAHSDRTQKGNSSENRGIKREGDDVK